MDEKRALTLCGGGAKGAYEIGAVRALYELGETFDIITGTSIGALTGAMLVQGDAESAAYGREAFDAATVAFGVRNFEDIPGGLTGLFSALRPGGKLFVLEFGMPRGRIFGTVYRFYFHRVLPRLGGWVSRDGKAYSYLPRSVDEFPYGEAFVRLLAEAGFEDCDCRNLFGGVAQIYTARRPDACEKTEKRR